MRVGLARLRTEVGLIICQNLKSHREKKWGNDSEPRLENIFAKPTFCFWLSRVKKCTLNVPSWESAR